MRKLLVLMLLVGALVPVAVASDYPVLDNQVEVRRAQLGWLLAIQEYTMESVVDYIDEVSEGNGTNVLDTILSDFKSRVDGVGVHTTHVGLNNFLRELREVTTSFRNEAKEMMDEYSGKPLLLGVKILVDLDGKQGDLEALKDHYWSVRKINVLENYDIRIERAQDILDLLEERGYNITGAQAKLDEIQALRVDLEAALDAENNIEVLAATLEALELSGELALIVKDLQVSVPPLMVLQHWVNVCDRVTERCGVIIGDLKTVGLDVTALESIHDDAESHLSDAETKLDEGDIIGAISSLELLKGDLLALCEAYGDLVFPDGVPEEFTTAMNSLKDRLEDLAGKMADSLDTVE